MEEKKIKFNLTLTQWSLPVIADFHKFGVRSTKNIEIYQILIIDSKWWTPAYFSITIREDEMQFYD
jgi:hypothetical protein